MYYIDTPTKKILAYPFENETGVWRTVLVVIEWPDGKARRWDDHRCRRQIVGGHVPWRIGFESILCPETSGAS